MTTEPTPGINRVSFALFSGMPSFTANGTHLIPEASNGTMLKTALILASSKKFTQNEESQHTSFSDFHHAYEQVILNEKKSCADHILAVMFAFQRNDDPETSQPSGTLKITMIEQEKLTCSIDGHDLTKYILPNHNHLKATVAAFELLGQLKYIGKSTWTTPLDALLQEYQKHTEDTAKDDYFRYFSDKMTEYLSPPTT